MKKPALLIFAFALAACGAVSSDEAGCPCAGIYLDGTGTADAVAYDVIAADGSVIKSAQLGPVKLPRAIYPGIYPIDPDTLAFMDVRLVRGGKVLIERKIPRKPLNFEDDSTLFYYKAGDIGP